MTFDSLKIKTYGYGIQQYYFTIPGKTYAGTIVTSSPFCDDPRIELNKVYALREIYLNNLNPDNLAL